MSSIIMLSGPVGAGKTTVARELITMLPEPLAYIEGDTFWKFVARPAKNTKYDNFRVIMRSMTAAAIPFVRSGFDVLIDFSIPPEFLVTAQKIVKDFPLHFVVLKPSESACEARAANRSEGKILDYTLYRGLYAMFEGVERYTIEEDLSAKALAKRIADEIKAGNFLVV